MDVRRIAIMVVLLAATVWAVTTSPLTKRLFGGPAKRPVPVAALGPEGSPATGTGGSAAAATAPAKPITRDQIGQWRDRYGTAWKRDPFYTAEEEDRLFNPKPFPGGGTTPPPPPPSYKVRTILISEVGKLVALDGSIVAEGEQIGDERVVEIRPDSVVLERHGQRRRLTLPGGTTPITESQSRQAGAPAR